MIRYFPQIYPDELVYSWFCRFYVHSGYFTHKMVLQELYCNRSDNPSKEFIGNLNPEAREVISKMYPLDVLTLNHTMYPRYARFIPLEQKKKALYHVSHESCDVHHLFCVLPRTGEEQYLQYCPLCAEEDREKFGETYWHRLHQLRNICICPVHKCKLEVTQVSAKSEKDYVFYPAEQIVQQKTTIFENNEFLMDYACFVKGVFESSVDFEHDTPISAILYSGMIGTKYLSRSGNRRNTKRLAEDMKAFYQKMGLNNIASVHQVQRVLLGSRYEFSVVCQIAFFLGITVDELVFPSLSKKQIHLEESSRYTKDNNPIDWTAMDNKIVPLMESTAKAIYDGTANKSGRPERVSERSIYRILNLKAHQIEKLPKCKAVLERYQESYPESWARKLVWAYDKLTQERTNDIHWSDIRALAGVKKNRCEKVIQYLPIYADMLTVERIKQLIEGRQ